MDFDACLMAAKAAGKVDPARADLVQKDFLDLVERYKLSGMAEPDARIAAGEEVLESFTKRAKARRHYELRRLAAFQRIKERYANAHKKDPDLILKDLDGTQRKIAGLTKMSMARIHDLLEQHHTNIGGTVRNRASLKDLVKERFGEASGNQSAKEMSDAIGDEFERLRSLANSHGMDIGKLEKYDLPHAHDGKKIKDAGRDQWFEDVYQWLDWNRMENHKTGKPFAVAKGAKPLRADAYELLAREPDDANPNGAIWDTLITGGQNSHEVSMSAGAAGLKNARTGHRVLHFKDFDSWWAYNEKYGAMNPFDAVLAHIKGMNRDIGMMMDWGPNPQGGLEAAIQQMTKDVMTDPAATAAQIRWIKYKGVKARAMMRVGNGSNEQPANEAFALIGGTVRTLLTPAHLAAAVLTQTGDLVSMAMAAKAVGQSPISPLKEIVSDLTGRLSKEDAKHLGFINEGWFEQSASRLMGEADIWRPAIAARISDAVLRLSGMKFLTDRCRVYAAAAFGRELAQVADKSFDELPEHMLIFMRNRDFTAREWDAVRAPEAIYTDNVGGKHLNPNWFAEATSLPRGEAEEIAAKFAELIEHHVDFAITSTSWRAQALMTGGSKPGSLVGELARSMKMYKSYPITMMFNQARRFAELQGHGRWQYAATLFSLWWITGAVTIQLKELSKGRDPRPMDDWRFWGAALLQGGGLGIFGDFLSSSTSRTGGGLYEVIGGPVVGLISDVSRAVGPNVVRAFEGKPTHFGRDAVNLGRRYNPLASLWYARAAFDRLVWDPLQMWLDPEATQQWAEQERKLQKDYGTRSYWRRGRIAPDRLPDLSNALGDLGQ